MYGNRPGFPETDLFETCAFHDRECSALAAVSQHLKVAFSTTEARPVVIERAAPPTSKHRMWKPTGRRAHTTAAPITCRSHGQPQPAEEHVQIVAAQVEIAQMRLLLLQQRTTGRDDEDIVSGHIRPRGGRTGVAHACHVDVVVVAAHVDATTTAAASAALIGGVRVRVRVTG